jgi:hypothetical protein
MDKAVGTFVPDYTTRAWALVKGWKRIAAGKYKRVMVQHHPLVQQSPG